MKVGVIGAGAAGLITSKLLSEADIDHDVFETNDEIGGTGIYSENFLDKHGMPVSSSIYKNLKTNLPKELMLFEGLNYNSDISYLAAETVLDYLKNFTTKFNLKKNIKFEHFVKKVSRTNDIWELEATNLNTGTVETHIYDYIFVCNGHYSCPVYPEICGSGSFPGTALHSHYYRVPEQFEGQTVMLIGMGPSAQDIAFDISPFAKCVYMSHHGPEFMKTLFPENIIHKPDVKAIDGNRIHFLDNSLEYVDSILYCTGYKYYFPFLDKSCEINLEDDYIYPLYKQMISIPHSSMIFMGIPKMTFVFQMLELQAKCAVNLLTGKAVLPSKEEMKADTYNWENHLISQGKFKKSYHIIKDCVQEYLDDIAKLGNLERLPKLLFNLLQASHESKKIALKAYRQKVFTIIDSNTFIQE